MPIDPRVPHQAVQHRHDPARRGVTTGRARAQGTRTYAQVQFGQHERIYVDIEDLEPIDLTEPTVPELLRALKFGKIGDLARILTFRKISSRLANVFYAMQASRTDFYAYQFKPVYKFIESANGRILIADEVGLGKTIEAGLIWQEVRARSDARTLLVVCPSMLRQKWKAELRNRFEVPAETRTGGEFVELLKDFEREGRGYQCAAVCSMHALRAKAAREALEVFSDTGLQFDLVIIDEAHYLRNVKTQTHRMGQSLSGIADNLLLLTATPLQLKSEDLFRLCNVLDPDEYDNQWLFEQRIQANEPVVLAQNALRRIPAEIEQARSQVSRLEDSQWFTSNPLVPLTHAKLSTMDQTRVSDRVEVTRLLENLNLMGASISRTRKREVQEWRVLREARVLRVEFSEQEMEFYSSVTEAVRRRVASTSGAIEAFSLMMPQRQMASCIPAMVQHYAETLQEEDENEESLAANIGWMNSGGTAVRSAPPDTNVARVARNWSTGNADSKYDALSRELKELFRREPGTKIIIFSFFKKTLSYLADRLNRDGFPPLVIHGDISMDERLEIIDQFRERPDDRILLSSEVGSEGLDLQFCRVLINYDLPWNPMKVEQRIGRLDRLGQKAPAISIINVSVVGTIEDRILERLYQRIGIFERSIGDLEPILGEMISELEVDLLSSQLTSEQEAQRIEQTRMALEERRRLEREMEDEGHLLFGNSDFVLEQIRDARKLGRWITPAEINAYIRDFFQRRYAGSRIRWDSPTDGHVSVDLSNAARNELASFCRNSDEPFTILTSPGEVVLAYTNDAANKTRHEFLNHFHPFVRWITRTYENESNPFFPVVAAKVHTDLVPPGDYLFMVETWNFKAIQEEPRIAYAMVSLGEGQECDATLAEQVVHTLIDSGEDWNHAADILQRPVVSKAVDQCERRLSQYREISFDVFQKRMIGAYERKRAHREGYLLRRQQSIERTIERMESQLVWSPDRTASIQSRIQGQRTKLTNLTAKIREELDSLERKTRPTMSFSEITGGICRVT